jgi:anti-sigma factor ChrR (cupin superfamily)
MPEPTLQVVDTNPIPWSSLEIPALKASIPIKTCIEDPETGMAVWKIKYVAGFTNISHWHNCSHGIYVLDGVLVTHAGSYGPGSFVWFPEGLTMSHGASQDNDVVILFITNKKFDIHYTHEEGGYPAKG